MEIKEKLISITTTLIKETNGNPQLVTIREIAKRAKVGVGLINYHFQSKENLIEVCVQNIIHNVISNSSPNFDGLNPIEKLKLSVKTPIDFLMANPEISKISILENYFNGKSNDNTMKTLEKYYFHISNLNLNADDYFRAVCLIHALQGIFLRWELYKDKFDFSNKTERGGLIDRLIDTVFGGTNNENSDI